MANKQTEQTKDSKAAPAAEKKKPTKSTEAWCKIKAVSPSAYAGMMTYYDWAEGRELTEAEFDRSLEKFLAAPISRPHA